MHISAFTTVASAVFGRNRFYVGCVGYTQGTTFTSYASYFDASTNRVVNIWNSLPDYVVHADSVNCFKSRLDTFWSNQDLVYNFKAEISGTGSRSKVV